MGEMFKNKFTIDDMLSRMGVQIVLDGTNLSEEDKENAEKLGDLVKVEKKEEEE